MDLGKLPTFLKNVDLHPKGKNIGEWHKKIMVMAKAFDVTSAFDWTHADDSKKCNTLLSSEQRKHLLKLTGDALKTALGSYGRSEEKKKKGNAAEMMMTLTLPGSLMKLTVPPTGAEDSPMAACIMARILEKFKKSDSFAVQDLFDKLNSLDIRTFNHDVEALGDEILEINMQLQQQGQGHQDSYLINALKKALKPAEHYDMLTVLIGRGNQTFKEAVDELAALLRNRRKRHNADDRVSSAMQIVHKMKQQIDNFGKRFSKKPRKPKRKRKGKCRCCNIEGHFERECYKKKRDQSNGNKGDKGKNNKNNYKNGGNKRRKNGNAYAINELNDLKAKMSKLTGAFKLLAEGKAIDLDKLGGIQEHQKTSEERPTKRLRFESVYPLQDDASPNNLHMMREIGPSTNGGCVYNAQEKETNSPIILDSGASHHFFNDRRLFLNTKKVTPISIQIADTKTASVTEIGEVLLRYTKPNGTSGQLLLHDVRLLPTAPMNYISTAKLDKRSHQFLIANGEIACSKNGEVQFRAKNKDGLHIAPAAVDESSPPPRVHH